MGEDQLAVIKELFYKVPGEHALVIGSTGTGKTQCLYYILRGINESNPKEHFIWFDTGKSAEILNLMEFGKVLIHHPLGTSVEVSTKKVELEGNAAFREFSSPMDLWDHLDKDRINIISIEPYYADPKDYSIVVTDAFKQLILHAKEYVFEDAGLIPMTIFMDELHYLVPGERSALSNQHNTGAKWFQRNIEVLRSMQIRIVGATQGWFKIRPGARSSFGWLWIKRGTFFSGDKPRLSKFNSQWQAIADKEVKVAFPDSQFTPPITLEYFGNGSKLGKVRYYQKKKPREEIKIAEVMAN